MEVTTLITGAGVKTIINRNYCFAYLLIGTVDTANPLQAISVSVGGVSVMEIQDQNHIQAISRFMMEALLGADVRVGQLWKIAGDFIPDQTMQLVLENSGATTPVVYGFSEGKSDAVPIAGGQITIQARDNQEFRNFTALFFPPTNFNYAQIRFADGHSDKLEGPEIDALFALYNQCDADGRLAGLHCIDNSRGDIDTVTLYADSGGTVLVSNILFP